MGAWDLDEVALQELLDQLPEPGAPTFETTGVSRAGVPAGPIVEIWFSTGRASTVARAIEELDREFRRAAAFLADGKKFPVRSTAGGLTLVSASPGSLDVVSEATGAVAAFLLSNPVQLIATLDWMWSRRPRMWGSPPPPPNATAEVVSALEGSIQAAIENDVPVRVMIRHEEGSLRTTFETRPRDGTLTT